MNFRIEKKLNKSLGRAGVITTSHGEIQTPAFVPVGTKASVKALTPEQVLDLGAEVILANTYHLYLQPGDELVARAGGLHKFMHWDSPIITDSGGFQVFSLGAAYGTGISKIITTPAPLLHKEGRNSSPPAKGECQKGEGVCALAKVSKDGVSFKSHLDGSIHYITPEKSIQIQHNLGADIIFAFDECTSPAEDLRYQAEALERTHRWAERSLEEHIKLINSPLEEYSDLGRREVDEFENISTPSRKRATPQEGNSPALFGIVQGGREESLRKKSAKILSEMRAEGPEGSEGFDGFGIGGSFAKEDMSSAVKWVNEILPEEKPRHLLGIGEPEDLFMGIENGVDLFDCVAPTRQARNGTLYTRKGKINISNTKYRNDFSPIEEGCECYVCTPLPNLPLAKGEEKARLPDGQGGGRYSRAYLSHLFHGKEMLAATLASIHNLYFIVHLVKKIRQSILDEDFFEFKKKFLEEYLG